MMETWGWFVCRRIPLSGLNGLLCPSLLWSVICVCSARPSCLSGSECTSPSLPCSPRTSYSLSSDGYTKWPPACWPPCILHTSRPSLTHPVGTYSAHSVKYWKRCTFWRPWQSVLKAVTSSNRSRPECQSCQRGCQWAAFSAWRFKCSSRLLEWCWQRYDTSYCPYPKSQTQSGFQVRFWCVRFLTNSNRLYRPRLSLFRYRFLTLTYQWYKWRFQAVCFGCLCRLSFSYKIIEFFRYCFLAFWPFSIFFCLWFPWIWSWRPRRCTYGKNWSWLGRFCSCKAMLSLSCRLHHPNCGPERHIEGLGRLKLRWWLSLQAWFSVWEYRP